MSDDSLRRQLRWRCRRGMKELDQLLLAYFDRVIVNADDVKVAGFADLLAAQDPDLWTWLVRREAPPRDDWKLLCEEIRSLHNA